MTSVKICGIKTLDQARVALEAGADFLGFVFYRPSHRYVEPSLVGNIVRVCRREYGGPGHWQAVGVMVDEPLASASTILDQAELDLAQVCGAEDRVYCSSLGRPAIRAVHVDPDGAPPTVDANDYGAVRLLLDTQVAGRYGGTGQTHAWEAVRDVAASSFLAGGLTPANVGRAITVARPWGVDVSSGVELNQAKDADLVREFVWEVRRADRDRN